MQNAGYLNGFMFSQQCLDDVKVFTSSLSVQKSHAILLQPSRCQGYPQFHASRKHNEEAFDPHKITLHISV
jgi:hypothetical protein